MIFFCEINKTGEEHVMVNTCLLNMLARNYPSDVVNVWMDRAHFANYQSIPQSLKTVHKNVLKPQKSNKLRWICKLILEILTINHIILSAVINKTKVVFFSSLSPVGNFYSSLIIPFVSNRIKFIITLHGELELAKSKSWDKKIENIYGNLLRHSFGRNIRNRKFLILSAEIYDNILECNLLKPHQMIYIEHPYIFPEIVNKKREVGENEPIIFGHIGVAKLMKQSQLLFKLAEAMKEYVIKGIVRFVIVGQVLEELRPFMNKYVSFEETTDFIARGDYEHQISVLDYSLFFFNEESYRFTSSGSIMDAIAYEKPILALKIKPLEDLFNKHSCAPGHLFSDLDAMTVAMKQIIDEHQVNYHRMVNCIRLKKELFSMDTLFPAFKVQMDQFLIS